MGMNMQLIMLKLIFVAFGLLGFGVIIIVIILFYFVLGGESHNPDPSRHLGVDGIGFGLRARGHRHASRCLDGPTIYLYEIQVGGCQGPCDQRLHGRDQRLHGRGQPWSKIT